MIKLCHLGLMGILCISMQAQSITMKELTPLAGQWQGTLTYLDYTSNKEVSIPVNLAVEVKGSKRLILNYTYPNEPQANSRSVIRVGGNNLNGRSIVGKSNEDNYLVVLTEGSGKDNGKPAKFTFTYTISPNFFAIRKDAEVDGDSFMRNRYEFSR